MKRVKKENFSGRDGEEALAEVEPEEGNEDEGEDYEDVEDLEEKEDENEDSEEDKQEVEEEAKPTLSNVLRDNSWAIRVKKCEELGGKSLVAGTIFIRKFNEGWFAANIEHYRHKKVISNCSVVCRDICGKWAKDERNKPC